MLKMFANAIFLFLSCSLLSKLLDYRFDSHFSARSYMGGRRQMGGGDWGLAPQI